MCKRKEKNGERIRKKKGQTMTWKEKKENVEEGEEGEDATREGEEERREEEEG
jgi:hypothetical protein